MRAPFWRPLPFWPLPRVSAPAGEAVLAGMRGAETVEAGEGDETLVGIGRGGGRGGGQNLSKSRPPNTRSRR